MPAPPGNLHFSEPAVPVPSCPTLAHPLPPQNIINVGTPAPVAPVMPPPGQLRGPSREPIIGHPPPMVGTIPVLASPIIAPHEYVRSHRLPIVIQPPAQVAQPVLPSPLPSRGTPVSLSEPVPPTNSDTSGDKCEELSTTGGGDAEVLRTLASAYVLRPCDTCVLLFRRT